jgi:hypothetical protein
MMAALTKEVRVHHCLNLSTANPSFGRDDDEEDVQKTLYDSLFDRDDTTEETDDREDGDD